MTRNGGRVKRNESFVSQRSIVVLSDGVMNNEALIICSHSSPIVSTTAHLSPKERIHHVTKTLISCLQHYLQIFFVV